MEKQISLFSNASSKPVKEKSYYDKVCDKLAKNKLDIKCHLYPSKRLSNILFWYVTDSKYMGEYREALCKMIKKIKPNSFYHLVHTPDNKLKIYQYDYWLTSKVIESETK